MLVGITIVVVCGFVLGVFVERHNASVAADLKADAAKIEADAKAVAAEVKAKL